MVLIFRVATNLGTTKKLNVIGISEIKSNCSFYIKEVFEKNFSLKSGDFEQKKFFVDN